MNISFKKFSYARVNSTFIALNKVYLINFKFNHQHTEAHNLLSDFPAYALR